MKILFFILFATAIILTMSGCYAYIGSRTYYETEYGTTPIKNCKEVNYVFEQKDDQLQLHKLTDRWSIYKDEARKYDEYIYTEVDNGGDVIAWAIGVPFRIALSPFALLGWCCIGEPETVKYDEQEYKRSPGRGFWNWINICAIWSKNDVGGRELDYEVLAVSERKGDIDFKDTLPSCPLQVEITDHKKTFSIKNPIVLKDLRHKCFDSALPERQMTVKISAKISDVEKSHEMRLYSIDLLTSEDKSFWDSLKTYPDEKYYSEYSNIIQWLSKLQQNNLISETAYIEISKSFQDKHDLIAKTLQERNDSRKKRMRNRSITPAGR